MAEKISVLIVKVDLDCHQCYKKIRKILCKLQDQETIRTISYDDGSKTIAIAGPFDPHRLACKIRCKGGKVVKDIQIMDAGGGKPPAKMAEPPPAPPVNNGKQKQKGKSAAAEPPPPAPETPPEMMTPPPDSQPAPPDMERAAPVPAFIEEKKPKAKPAELDFEPPPPKEVPVDLPVALPPPVLKQRPPTPPPAAEPPVLENVIPTVEIPSWPAPPVGPCGCHCCAPCYQGYYEGCRCSSCGRVYGYAIAGPPPAPAGCGYHGCRVFSDEDPTAACSIM
ncbi:protein PYRICULARIA ORYZAE RESISTANCE 21-like [Phragmites australis]|uniref:protein PYRICULARIA ORYZAE RESISTANCE 21-like n=1 Tax=Phragmites australis TaxID=29695 RepID=UPI002D78F9DF|nr:protein PYRICULARIA ORYZAE RESISTANCE 21-like [Phragmites australis]